MPPIVRDRKRELEHICQRFGVERLEMFGSAVSGTFNAASDIDFLVSFSDSAKAKAFDNYFGLLESLEKMFGRRVDLVTAASLQNPYLISEIEQSRQLVYAETQ